MTVAAVAEVNLEAEGNWNQELGNNLQSPLLDYLLCPTLRARSHLLMTPSPTPPPRNKHSEHDPERGISNSNHNRHRDPLRLQRQNNMPKDDPAKMKVASIPKPPSSFAKVLISFNPLAEKLK